jgi:Flp pilus assembly protein TadG
MLSISRKTRRRPSGLAALEVAVSAFLLVVFSALGVDTCLVVYAIAVNDSCSRDAARAAGQQNNLANAIQAAQTELKVHQTDGMLVGQPTLVSTASPAFVYNDFGGNPPANVSPYVTVTTEVKVKLPGTLKFFGDIFMPNGTLKFQRSYTFPIVKEKFYG